ncbi:ATP synthase d subunit [Borealophlyctis nickersoniae]|nr:ATP synthase d subunit [Borealophlyctis nickersoniae]
MATPVRSAATKIDWAGLSTKLKPETVAAINAFRRRHMDLTKTVADLKEANTSIDFEHYRRILKNQKVVAEAEKAFKSFTPATYDLAEQLRIIKEQESKAVSAAEATAQKVAGELGDLKKLLTNIETARPLEQLTIDDVAKAYPELMPTVDKMVRRHQWFVPGYYERFGEFVVGF